MGKTVLLVPSVFELEVGTLYILQDENGELIKLEIEYDRPGYKQHAKES